MAKSGWASMARRCLPDVVYRSLARLPRNPISYIKRFGVMPGTALYLGLIGLRGRVAEITIPGIRTRVFLRSGTSDVTNLEEIFIRKQYHIALGAEPRSIIDAGANIGLATLFFANRYPNARIIAIEPDQLNFELLVKNTQGYPNIRAIRSGLWSRSVPLRIVNPGDEPWAFRVEESINGCGISAITVEELLTEIGGGRVDLIKFDIEGAEQDIMAQSQGWIGRVEAIVAEIHGMACEEAFFQAVEGGGFRYCHLMGDLVFAWRQAVSGTSRSSVSWKWE